MSTAQRTRRRFLQLSIVACSAVVAWLATAGPASLRNLFSRAFRRDPGSLGLDEFRAALGSTVEITGEDGSRFPARIAKIRECHSAPRLQQFSVVFESELGEPLPQDNYLVDHPEFGSCELLLVPVVSRRSRIDYEATFTRFIV